MVVARKYPLAMSRQNVAPALGHGTTGLERATPAVACIFNCLMSLERKNCQKQPTLYSSKASVIVCALRLRRFIKSCDIDQRHFEIERSVLCIRIRDVFSTEGNMLYKMNKMWCTHPALDKTHSLRFGPYLPLL